MTPSAPDWDALRGTIAGEVILPGSPDYELARKPAIARFHDARPRAVVRCKTPEDVAATIALARRSGLPTAARSGGHCFAGRSSTSGVVIDVTPMRVVSVSDGVATVGAGARLGEVYDTLDEQDLTIPAGCGPDVGIAGLTLGGGLGILGRRYGLTCDHLLAAQVVLADGRVVVCDDHRDQELFWALRGAGGGNFGVVTSLSFSTVPAPAATSFHLVWPHTQAVAVIQAWQAWAPAGPDELAASLLLTASGDIDRPPVVNVFGAMLGGESDAVDLLDELVARAGTDPARSGRWGTPSASRSSSGARCSPRRWRRWWTASRRGGLRASRASWTSRRGAARTTASALTPPPSCIAMRCCCSSRRPRWSRTRRARSGRPPSIGWRGRGRWSTRGGREACTRISPTRTWR